MRLFLLTCSLLFIAAPAPADVIRCTDAAGKVSYTDGPCPAGARQSGQVPVPETAGPDANDDRAAREQLASVERARRLQRETVDAVARQAQAAAPAGATIINGRGGSSTGDVPAVDPNAATTPDGTVVADTWYPDGIGYGRAVPPRDMRPRMRNCDAGGCTDTQGNHYNRQGQPDRYRNIEGKTCRMVNSTQLCR